MMSARTHSISLASRRSIEERGLHGLQGAEHIINTIRARRSVTRLILGHNTLGDSGCNRLFDFLGSVEGLNYPISEITLNKNGIGNEGLWAIVRFLRESTHVRLLFLQYNRFEPDIKLSTAFTVAINRSHLTGLSLSTNSGFSDQFLKIFISALDSPTLRELHVSACKLTSASGAHISSFIASPRCRLRIFKCNGNELGLRAVQGILESVALHNWTIVTLELLSNGNITDADINRGDLHEFWKVVERRTKFLTARNNTLQWQTRTGACQLLRCSRPLLLASERSETPLVLPTEIILYILSFVAPTLSEAQRIRVFQYSSDIRTLPRLLPTLTLRSQTDCAPDPSVSTTCRHEEERQRWLDLVGCNFYER